MAARARLPFGQGFFYVCRPKFLPEKDYRVRTALSKFYLSLTDILVIVGRLAVKKAPSVRRIVFMNIKIGRTHEIELFSRI